MSTRDSDVSSVVPCSATILVGGSSTSEMTGAVVSEAYWATYAPAGSSERDSLHPMVSTYMRPGYHHSSDSEGRVPFCRQQGLQSVGARIGVHVKAQALPDQAMLAKEEAFRPSSHSSIC